MATVGGDLGRRTPLAARLTALDGARVGAAGRLRVAFEEVVARVSQPSRPPAGSHRLRDGGPGQLAVGAKDLVDDPLYGRVR